MFSLRYNFAVLIGEGLMLTTKAMIADIPEDKGDPMAGMGGGGMGM